MAAWVVLKKMQLSNSAEIEKKKTHSQSSIKDDKRHKRKTSVCHEVV